MDFWAIAKRNVIELLAGVVLAVGGVLFTIQAAGNDGKAWHVIAGAVLSVLGGFLLSWIIARCQLEADFDSRLKASREELFGHLDTVSRALGQASWQISAAVDDAETGAIEADVALQLIRQQATAIVGQVNELGVLRGTRFDPADLVETHDQLENLRKLLRGTTTAEPTGEAPTGLAQEEVARQVEVVQAQIGRLLDRDAIDRVETNCPKCGARNSAELGVVQGSTSGLIQCGTCGSGYLAHRTSSGVIIRGRPTPIGKTIPAEAVNSACPSCKHMQTTSVGGDDRPVRSVLCTGCGGKYNLHFSGIDWRPGSRLQSTYSTSAAAVKTTTVPDATDGQPLARLACPSCGQEVLRRGTYGSMKLTCLNCLTVSDDSTSNGPANSRKAELRTCGPEVAEGPPYKNRPIIRCTCGERRTLIHRSGSMFRGACDDCEIVYDMSSEAYDSRRAQAREIPHDGAGSADLTRA